jgi:hypothetical protein
VRIMLAVALCGILYASCGISAGAVCTGASVSAFGAKGYAHSDDVTRRDLAEGTAWMELVPMRSTQGNKLNAVSSDLGMNIPDSSCP